MTEARSSEKIDELIRRADAGYRGFPDFVAWAATRIDRGVWQSALESFEAEKQQASPAALQRTVQFALRAAAVDTGAIEGLYQVDRGFTFSVAAQAATWESDLADKGPRVRDLFEAQLAGLELVVDAVTSRTEISEAWIRQLHEVLCSQQDTYRVQTAAGSQDQALPKGVYKAHSNHVQLADGSLHSYCPVDRTSDEMCRLVAQLRSAEFLNAHPVLQAAYSHHGLVVVHPFADGNGRVARALASVFTFRACSIPLVVYADQKTRYLDALRDADAESYERFASFVLQVSVDTMNELAARMREARATTVRETAGGLDRFYASAIPSTPRELDAIASRVAGIVREEIERVLAAASLPLRVAFQAHLTRSLDPPNESGFRRVGDGGASVSVIVRSDEPPLAVARRYHVVVAGDANAFYALQVEHAGKRGAREDPLRLRLDLVHPSLTTSFRRQLEPWVRLRVAELMADFESRSTATLRPTPS